MILILLFGFLLYCELLGASFVWDDYILVVRNQYIQDFSHIRQILTEDLASGAGQQYYFYRPMQNISYAIDYALYGLNPFGFHLTNILLHLAASLAVFRIFLLFSSNEWEALLAGGLFMIHPIHSSVVSYISSRADLLCGVFIFWSFFFFVQSYQLYKRRSLIVSLVLFVMALFSKEYAMIFPVLVILYHWSRNEGKENYRWALFAGMTLIFVVFRLVFVDKVLSLNTYNVPVVSKLPGACVAFWEYARLLFNPAHLHMSYGNFLYSLSNPLVWKGLMLFVLVVGLTFYLYRRGNQILLKFGLVWYWVGLLPILIFPVNAFMAENWLYIPTMGFVFLLSFLLTKLLDVPKMRIVGCLLIGLIIFSYSYKTKQYLSNWQNEIKLFSWTAQYAKHNGKVFFNLGNAYLRQGEVSQAVFNYRKALEINPQIKEAQDALDQLSNQTIN